MLEGNLYGDVDHPVYAPPADAFPESKLLDEEQRHAFAEVFSVNREYTYKLCFRGGDHGFSPSAFHSRCDGKGKTVTIARTTAESPGGPRLFGGFAGTSWSTSSGYRSNYDSFLFRYTEEGGFERTDSVSSTSYAQYTHSNYCPRFGERERECVCVCVEGGGR